MKEIQEGRAGAYVLEGSLEEKGTEESKEDVPEWTGIRSVEGSDWGAEKANGSRREYCANGFKFDPLHRQIHPNRYG